MRYIVAKGDLSKFEKLFTKILPVLVFLFTVLLFRSFSLESSQEVMRFLFYPDFSKLNMTSLGRALGHVFFTLSIGLGILATYGAYFKNDVHLPAVGFRVTIIDMIVSIMALLMVFPVAFLSDTFARSKTLPFDLSGGKNTVRYRTYHVCFRNTNFIFQHLCI